MKFKKCLLPVVMLASFTLAGCQSNADDHAADVYQTDQLNTKQETKTVNIISILPAKVAVDNSQNKRNAQAFGALIGAVAGGVIGHNVGSGSNSGTTAVIPPLINTKRRVTMYVPIMPQAMLANKLPSKACWKKV